jgi:hypothetical protein
MDDAKKVAASQKRTSGAEALRFCGIFGMAEAMPLSKTGFFGGL